MNGAAKTGSITVEKDNNMLINRKINPLLEALQYYNRRVNGTSVSDTMIRLENAYPERVHEIHSTVAPILELDNLLSAELVPDMDRLNFFFKQFEGVNGADSIGTSAASIIFFEEAYKKNLRIPLQCTKILQSHNFLMPYFQPEHVCFR